MTDFPEFAAREQSGWSDDAIVENYIKKFGPVTDEVGKDLSSRHAGSGVRLLDLCCGQGNVTAMAAERGAIVTGLDFSPQMLSRAAERAPGVALIQGDAADLPFDDESFDVVVCNFGMMHLPDQPAALREVARVLRPGGTFAIATWEAPMRSPAFGIFFGTLREMLDMSKAPPQPDLFAFADPDTARQMISDAGLSVTGHEVLSPVWRFDDADGLFDVYATGTVAASMLIASLPAEIVVDLKTRVADAVSQKCADSDGYTVPVPVAVVTAQKPD